MNRYALLKDSINDSIFGVIVDSNGLSKFYGVSAKGLEWSKWANGINVKSENNGLPIGVVVGGYSALRNTSPNYIQALVDTVSLRNPSINKKQGISDSLIKNSSSVVPGVRDAELRAFDIDKRNEAIAFKARAFRTDSKVSSLLTQVRAERLGFVSAEGVFSSRNPIHTPEVKQAEIIDSYGRSLQRAIGLSLIRKKSVKMLAVVRKDQALAKSFGIEVKAASIGPKIGSRLSGGLRAAPAGMSFVDITGVTDADTDGIVFEGKPGLERPIIPRFMVPKDLARKLSGIVEGDAEVIEKQRRAGNTSVQFDEGKLRNIIASVGGDANMLTALTGENGIPVTTPSGRERLSVSAPSPTGIARDVARDAVIGSRVRSGQRSDLGDATPLSSGELKKLSQQELVDRLIEDRNAGLNLEEAAKKYGLKGGRAEARRLEAREMSRRDSGMRSRSTEQKRIDSNLRAMDAAVGGYARWDDDSWDNYRQVGRVLDGENLNQADRDSLSEAADKIASGELLEELKPNDRRQVVSDFRMASGMLRSRSDYDSSLSRNGWRKNGDKWNKGNWEVEVLVDENNGANRLVARNKEIGETLEQERGADVGALKHLNVFESILRGSDDRGFDDDGGMRSRSGGMRSRNFKMSGAPKEIQDSYSEDDIKKIENALRTGGLQDLRLRWDSENNGWMLDSFDADGEVFIEADAPLVSLTDGISDAIADRYDSVAYDGEPPYLSNMNELLPDEEDRDDSWIKEYPVSGMRSRSGGMRSRVDDLSFAYPDEDDEGIYTNGDIVDEFLPEDYETSPDKETWDTLKEIANILDGSPSEMSSSTVSKHIDDIKSGKVLSDERDRDRATILEFFENGRTAIERGVTRRDVYSDLQERVNELDAQSDRVVARIDKDKEQNDGKKFYDLDRQLGRVLDQTDEIKDRMRKEFPDLYNKPRDPGMRSRSGMRSRTEPLFEAERLDGDLSDAQKSQLYEAAFKNPRINPKDLDDGNLSDDDLMELTGMDFYNPEVNDDLAADIEDLMVERDNKRLDAEGRSSGIAKDNARSVIKHWQDSVDDDPDKMGDLLSSYEGDLVAAMEDHYDDYLNGQLDTFENRRDGGMRSRSGGMRSSNYTTMDDIGTTDPSSRKRREVINSRLDREPVLNGRILRINELVSYQPGKQEHEAMSNEIANHIAKTRDAIYDAVLSGDIDTEEADDFIYQMFDTLESPLQEVFGEDNSGKWNNRKTYAQEQFEKDFRSDAEERFKKAAVIAESMGVLKELEADSKPILEPNDFEPRKSEYLIDEANKYLDEEYEYLENWSEENPLVNSDEAYTDWAEKIKEQTRLLEDDDLNDRVDSFLREREVEFSNLAYRNERDHLAGRADAVMRGAGMRSRSGGMRSSTELRGRDFKRDANIRANHLGKDAKTWPRTARLQDVIYPERPHTGADDVERSDKIILSSPSENGGPEGKVYIAEFDDETGTLTVSWGRADSRNLQTKIYSGKTREDFHKLLRGKEQRGYRLEGGHIPAKYSTSLSYYGEDVDWKADHEKQAKMGMRSSTGTEQRPYFNVSVTGSSALRQASYDAEKEELVVTYANGKTYTYKNFSNDDLDNALSGPDYVLTGTAVNQIKKNHDFREGGVHTFDPEYQDIQGPGGQIGTGKLSRLGRREKTQIPVSGSSAIEALTWDDDKKDLIVTYAGGRTYTYKDVDSYWIEDLERETGTGRIINNIKKEGYRVVGGGEHGDMPSEGLTAERAEFGMRSRMAPSSGRIRAAEMEISARPQGMASRRSEGLRDPRFAVPGRDRVDPSDGELWGRLSDEEKTTVADRAVNREKMLLNEFKQRFPRWWDRASKEADKKGWDKDLMNGGNAGWMDELHRFVTRLADDPDYPEKNRIDAEKQFNDLQALYNMRSNRGVHDLLEHLNPTSRRYLFDDARRDDSKKTRISASGKEMKTPSTAPRPLGDPIDTGTPIREQVGQNEKKPLKARLDAYYKRMSDKILYTDPARQARREMRKARRQGINAGGFTTSEANPVDDAKRKIRRRKRLKEMRKNRTRDIGSISDSSTDNRIDGRLAHTDSQGSLVFGDKLTSTLATMMKNYRTESKLKKTKGGVSRNRALAVLWDGAGYNGTPHVVTPEEFKALHAAGWVPVVRGHGSGANGVRYANDWIDDPVRFITGQGGEAQGEGEYWARPTQGGGGWFSWMDGSLPAGTVGLLPPSTRRVSKAELGKIKSEHAPLAKSIKAFDAGLPSGEREKMDAEEYVTQLRDHLRTSLGPVYESTMSTKMGQMTSKILESLSGSSDSKKQELLDALEFLELISTKRTSNSYAPLLGYDTIMADSGVELIHNRTAITIVGDTLTRDDAVKLAKSKA